MTEPRSRIETPSATFRIFPSPAFNSKTSRPLLADARLFAGSIDLLTDNFKPGTVDAVVGIDARGFIFAAAAAIKLEAGFVPVRKKGKLPYQTHEQDYALEYGTATVAMHVDALKPGSRVLLIDDLLATGGTAAAAAALVQKLGGKILEISFPDRTELPRRPREAEEYPGPLAGRLLNAPRLRQLAPSGRPSKLVTTEINGRNIATTMLPTTIARNTISTGSSSEVSPLAALSNSSS